MVAKVKVIGTATNMPVIIVRGQMFFKSIPVPANYQTALKNVVVNLTNMGYEVIEEENEK